MSTEVKAVARGPPSHHGVTAVLSNPQTPVTIPVDVMCGVTGWVQGQQICKHAPKACKVRQKQGKIYLSIIKIPASLFMKQPFKFSICPPLVRVIGEFSSYCFRKHSFLQSLTSFCLPFRSLFWHLFLKKFTLDSNIYMTNTQLSFWFRC